MPVLGWRRRKQGSPNQIGKAFPVEEPHGNKNELPKALRQVSFSEITDSIEARRRKKMTEEELADEEMIDEILAEEKAEAEEAEKKRNIVQRLSDRLEEEQKKRRMKDALIAAKDEQEMNETEAGDGYDKYQENLEKIRKARERENDVFG